MGVTTLNEIDPSTSDSLVLFTVSEHEVLPAECMEIVIVAM